MHDIAGRPSLVNKSEEISLNNLLKKEIEDFQCNKGTSKSLGSNKNRMVEKLYSPLSVAIPRSIFCFLKLKKVSASH